MAYIGKDPLPSATRREIEHQLLETLSHPSKKVSKALLLELLTETEKIMLAKRLAALVLLADDTSYYTIEQVLGMSTSTSKRLHGELLSDQFPYIENHFLSKKMHKEEIKKIAKLLRGGLPPRRYIMKTRTTTKKKFL